MNAPPFPLNPQTGEWFQNWVWNGARWVASPTTGLRVLTQVFTASGPYMPSPGLVSLMVECVGGGGAGGTAIGSSADATTAGWIGGGGGGASGCYSRKTIPAALVRGGVLVTVGTGGQSAEPPAPGGDGSATAFGGLCTAAGGHGGQAFNLGLNTWGVGGGRASGIGIGDFGELGASGSNGSILWWDPGFGQGAVSGGMGGATMYGSSGPAGIAIIGTSQNGADGFQGGGGTGGASGQYDMAGVGGAGGDGLCIVTEYCWGDRDQAMPEWRPPLDVNVHWPKPPFPGGAWPPGAWWPPGGWWGPGPWPSVPGGPRPREAIGGREFEAGQPYDQSINPETGLPWEDDA